MITEKFAQAIIDAADFAKRAHINHPRKLTDRVRFHDQRTPYIVHPIWCAMTILTETKLDETTRLNGYLALMWHDVLEDTFISLPSSTDETVKKLVNDMTFKSFEEETALLWEKSPLVRLLKLYDKTSNLLDASHLNEAKWNRYTEFTNKLQEDVQRNYGKLNIVKIAQAIATPFNTCSNNT